MSALNLSFVSCTIKKTHSRRIEPNLVDVDERRMAHARVRDDHKAAFTPSLKEGDAAADVYHLSNP